MKLELTRWFHLTIGGQSLVRCRKCRRPGWTLLELAVVFAIITLMISVLLPAVQSARGRVRAAACDNKLRQLALGAILHENARRHFPGNGWGFAWVGEKGNSFGDNQPGGWIHAILPFVEQQQVWDLTGDEFSRMRAMETPLPLLMCPSRRDGQLLPYTLRRHTLRNAVAPAAGRQNGLCGVCWQPDGSHRSRSRIKTGISYVPVA